MNTPETDAAEKMAFAQEYMVPTDFARQLELERNEARREAAKWKANHDNQVAIKSVLIQRPDLGDRAQRIEALIKENEAMRETRAELNQRLQERQESFQAQLIRIEDIWRGKLAESRKDADRLYNCLLEAQFGESLDIAYVQNVLAQHEELAAIG